jgi:hypothetical protein
LKYLTSLISIPQLPADPPRFIDTAPPTKRQEIRAPTPKKEEPKEMDLLNLDRENVIFNNINY